MIDTPFQTSEKNYNNNKNNNNNNNDNNNNINNNNNNYNNNNKNENYNNNNNNNNDNNNNNNTNNNNNNNNDNNNNNNNNNDYFNATTEPSEELLVTLPAPHAAAAMGDLKSLKKFEKKDKSLLASLDGMKRKPLFYAAVYGRDTVLSYLIKIFDLKYIVHGDCNGFFIIINFFFFNLLLLLFYLLFLNFY
jgi:DNA mismatch repair ATPase MutL